jgi:UDPglucose 6-dehydrogenase
MSDADAVIILTEWNEFRALDLARAKSLLSKPLMIDLRNIYSPDEMKRNGFDYISIGRRPAYGASGNG